MSIHHLFFGEEMNSGDCPICLNSIGNENGQVEPCFHVFCLKCIQKWTETSVNCPVCRGRLTSINGSQLETSGMAGLARDAIGQDQVVATQTDRCEECNEPLEILGMLLCSHCRNRLCRCEECTEDILFKDEIFWFCRRCEQWTPCPTPAIGNSTFQIEEPEYALYQFENQEDTNSRDNPSTSFNSSNATITYHQNTNVMDQIVLAMNKERNTPGLTTLLSDKKIGQDQVVATQTDRCEECDEPLEILGMLLCSHCDNRLDRCEECTEDILSKDENFWFCRRCEQWTPCPTPAIGNSTFQIEEPEYALYQFENQGDTNSRDNPSTSFNSSNATITYHQNTNVMDQIVLAMNKERNTPGLTTSLSDKKALKSDPERMKRIEKAKREYKPASHRKTRRARSRAAKERSRAKDERSERSSRRFRALNNGRSTDDTRPG